MRRIPPLKLQRVPLNEEAASLPGFEWAGGDIGDRSKLGGAPDFIQGDETPICPVCRRKMTFYAQLDSMSDDVMLADCGMIYVFACFDCLETAAILQSH